MDEAPKIGHNSAPNYDGAEATKKMIAQLIRIYERGKYFSAYKDDVSPTNINRTVDLIYAEVAKNIHAGNMALDVGNQIKQLDRVSMLPDQSQENLPMPGPNP